MPSEMYNAGGLTLDNDNGSEVGGLLGIIGRGVNNITGATASNQFSAAEAEKARLFNSAEAKKQRDFQEYMSSTALQRQVADAKAAGINPASLQGDGASTPSASSASASAAQASNQGSGILGLVGRIAAAAIGKSLAAKFTNTALSAKSSASTVAKVAQEANSAKKAFDRYGVLKQSKKAERPSSWSEADWQKFFKANGF